jgi:hypothetical protein
MPITFGFPDCMQAWNEPPSTAQYSARDEAEDDEAEQPAVDRVGARLPLLKASLNAPEIVLVHCQLTVRNADFDRSAVACLARQDDHSGRRSPVFRQQLVDQSLALKSLSLKQPQFVQVSKPSVHSDRPPSTV